MGDVSILIKLTVDANTRKITIPNNGTIFGVVGDIEINRVMFSVPRYYSGFDMKDFVARVNYVNPNGELNFYESSDITETEDTVTFTWLMGSDVTKYAGDVKFSIKLYKVSGNTYIKSFNTTTGIGKVLDGLDVEKQITSDQQTTLLSKLEEDIKASIDEYVNNQVTKNVNTYISNNVQKKVDAVVQEEITELKKDSVVQQVESNKTDIAGIKSGIVVQQNTQPTADTTQIWVDTSDEEEIEVPDMAEFNELVAKTSSLKEDISTKITKFYASNQGETHITDSDNGKIMDMMIYGKSSQDGTPSPENPVEIKSVVNPTVKLSNEDGTESQTVALPYILNAIPVSSDGNVTIDGQQYIADYVDVERRKLMKRVYEYVFTGGEKWNTATDGAYFMSFNRDIMDSSKGKKCLCSCLIVNILNETRKGENYISTQALDDTCRVWISPNVVTSKLVGEKVFLALTVPEEIPLTQEEIRAFKELATYYPVTNVNVTSKQLDGYTVFNYPISMQNGWNYVKQQIGDTREYIYDMDLQSAEAYVNSEYAVALTELEV